MLIQPLRLEPGDRVRRQPVGLLADQGTQGLLEIARGDTAQVEPGDEFIQTLSPLQVWWQQLTVEANARTTAVPDLGYLDIDIPNACLNGALW
ncbi:hypothetical protein GCM10011533_36900 [Streptosporangium jomthongense]|nr:hypothetical protein GCM10011533_36900 [Streptosporangium jomthongense]